MFRVFISSEPVAKPVLPRHSTAGEQGICRRLPPRRAAAVLRSSGFEITSKEMPYRGLGTGIQRALELGAKIDFVSDRELNVFKAILYPNLTSANEKSSVDVPVNVPVTLSTAEKVEQAIQMNPGINRKRLATLCGLTEKTISRQFKLLRGRVEFRGAPKTEGYYAK